ncbi:MAG: 2-oxo acid dehydrogenase subunit E2 [Bordetella sp.]|nr:MAG: 2-oxo acid dehydrogenase subunit E2 [Bordetella sp.]
MSDIVKITVPDIGVESSKEIQVIETLVSIGDTVKNQQGIIVVESDKASIEIPATMSGKVKFIYIKTGDKIIQGSPILDLEIEDLEIKIQSSKNLIKNEENSDVSLEKTGINLQNNLESKDISSYEKLPLSSPTVRKFARELGVNLNHIKGSAKNNRITINDIREFVKNTLNSKSTASNRNDLLGISILPKIDFEKFGSIEIKPLSTMRKIIGDKLHRNWVNIPHITNNDEADITDLENFRVSINKENEKLGIKITILAFLIKAVSISLKEYPEFNSSLDENNLIFKKYYNIGFAIDIKKGLIVPVINNVDRMGIIDIAKKIKELSEKARNSKISPSELEGGCFSISSLGNIGGTSFTPIINSPEVAILGVSKAQYKPMWNQEKFLPRLMLPLSLSYDHRIIDGALAARFNSNLIKILTDYRRALL